MISRAESILHLCGAAAISTALIGVGLGAVGPRARVRGLWLAAGAAAAAMTLFVANVELNFAPGGHELIVAAGAVLFGLAVAVPLVARGLRGRYVGEHPHCRRCGFDLTGRPATSDACSECGATLDAPGAVTTGVRRRRPVPLAMGAFAMVLSLAIGSVVARDALARSGGFSLVRMKPTGWLIGAVQRGRPADQAAAAAELSRRLWASDLDESQAQAFVAAATANLAARPWMAAPAGMAAAEAWSRGLLDEVTMRGAIRAFASPATLTLAPQSSPTRVPFAVTLDGLTRLQSPGRATCRIEVRDRVDTIDGAPVPAAAVAGAGPVMPSAFPWSWTPSPQTSLPFGRLYRLDAAPLPAGPATVRVRATVDVTLDVPSRETLVEPIPIDVTATTTVVPGLTRPLPSAGGADARARGVAQLQVRRDPVHTSGWITINVAPFVGDLVARDVAGDRVLCEVWADRGLCVLEFDGVPPDDGLVLVPRPERGVEMLASPTTYQHEIPVTAQLEVAWRRRPTTRAATSRPAGWGAR